MRTISTYRRRPGLIDIHWPARVNVYGYILKAASNFDATFNPFATGPTTGWASRSIHNQAMDSGAFRGRTRVIFNPADYTLDDAKPLWLRIATVNLAGVVGADESIHLILPYNAQPNRPVVIHGTVAAAADLTTSLEINLPQQCTNPTIQNDGANDLYVAFELGGSEFRVPPLSTEFTNFYSMTEAFHQLFLRGSGGATTISANLVLRNEAR
jgi:hypothetical protein